MQSQQNLLSTATDLESTENISNLMDSIFFPGNKLKNEKLPSNWRIDNLNYIVAY